MWYVSLPRGRYLGGNSFPLNIRAANESTFKWYHSCFSAARWFINAVYAYQFSFMWLICFAVLIDISAILAALYWFLDQVYINNLLPMLVLNGRISFYIISTVGIANLTLEGRFRTANVDPTRCTPTYSTCNATSTRDSVQWAVSSSLNRPAQ